MTPPIFHIGDLVEITGPSAVGARICIGEKFTISEILKRADSEAYSDADHTWYPASSLRLVEELKIGDWVEVIGPCSKLYCVRPDDPIVFQIHSTPWGNFCGDMNRPAYPATSLRKLAPEEIERHACSGKPAYEYPTTPVKDFEELSLKDVARMASICKNEYGVWISTLLGRVDKSEERLSAIEHRQSAICEYNIETEQRLQKLESIQQHHAIPVPEKLNEIQELRRRVHDLEMSLNGFTNGSEPEYVPGISYVKDPIKDRLSAIEKRQNEAREYSDNLYKLAERIYDLQKRLEFVEAFQKDECPNGHQIPNGEPIRVTIERGDEAHTYCDTCPGECLNWSEKVLDDMRVD